MSALPVNEFIVKIASRCNLNCDYCYEYNLGDSTWRSQPAVMSLETLGRAADRIVEHVRAHHLQRVNEILGARLNTIHNLYYYQQLMRDIRAAIDLNRYAEFVEQFRNERQLLKQRGD